MSEEIPSLERLTKRLDVLIRILFETSSFKGTGIPMTKRIEILDSCGFRPVEISDILGRTQSYVNKELSRLRKSEID